METDVRTGKINMRNAEKMHTMPGLWPQYSALPHSQKDKKQVPTAADSIAKTTPDL